MFKTITPEQAGISSRAILEFVKTLEEYHLAPHNILMARGNDIFSECYCSTNYHTAVNVGREMYEYI